MKKKLLIKSVIVMMVGVLSVLSFTGCGDKSMAYSGELTLNQAFSQSGTHIWYLCKAEEDDYDYEYEEPRSYTLTKESPIYEVLVVDNGEVVAYTTGFQGRDNEKSMLTMGEVASAEDEEVIGLVQKAEKRMGKWFMKKYNKILEKGPGSNGKYNWNGEYYSEDDMKDFIEHWEEYNPEKMIASPYKVRIDTNDTGSSAEFEELIYVNRYGDEKVTPGDGCASWFYNESFFGNVYDNSYQGFYRYKEHSGGMCWVTKCEEDASIFLDEPNKDKHLIDPSDDFDWDKWLLENFDFLEKEGGEK